MVIKSYSKINLTLKVNSKSKKIYMKFSLYIVG